jgi:hypothetical protein
MNNLKTQTSFKVIFASTAIMVLAACGGGGGGTPATTPPAAPIPAVVATPVCLSTAKNLSPMLNGTSLVAVCGNLFVDPAVDKSQYAGIADSLNMAAAADKQVYGVLQAALPDVIVCSTVACGTYFAGPSLRNTTLLTGARAGQYVVPRTTVVLTSASYNRNTYILAHELSHVEVASRLNGAHVPAWFDEGLATFVGGEPVCTGVVGKGIPSLLTLDQESDWVAYTNNTAVFEKTYCQARAEVAAWAAKRGTMAVNALLLAVSQGQVFKTVYGPMQTE